MGAWDVGNVIIMMKSEEYGMGVTSNMDGELTNG